jgi:hypothetical protein
MMQNWHCCSYGHGSAHVGEVFVRDPRYIMARMEERRGYGLSSGNVLTWERSERQSVAMTRWEVIYIMVQG